MFTKHTLIPTCTKMSEDELVREEIEAQKKQVENKKKKLSDAYVRKANKVQEYVSFKYISKNILVIDVLLYKVKGRIKPHVEGGVETDIWEGSGANSEGGASNTCRVVCKGRLQ